ncbi:MAG: M61 family metallopeptidase [Myxococcales bacterium]|nr:M61 family metallopeptidase [Myxococcales bacterium]
MARRRFARLGRFGVALIPALALSVSGDISNAAPPAAPAPISAATPAAPPARGLIARGRVVRYTLKIQDPASQYLDVTMEIGSAAGRHTEVAMPAWTPGSYRIRDFARNVDGLRAETLAGAPLTVEKRDKQTWRIKNLHRGFRVHYRVFADQLTVRESYVDPQRAVINGTSVFLYLPKQTGRAADLDVELPRGWDAHAAMPQYTPQGGGTRPLVRRFAAESYDALVDAPLLLGAPTVRAFAVDGHRVELVYSAVAGSNIDLDRFTGDLERLVVTFSRLMGGLPFERYLFLLAAETERGGGLEHVDSTVMILPRDGFLDPGGYRHACTLAAHEFFHLWNVKRIHDKALGPFDYSRENYSRLLWFHEGFTDAIVPLALVRAGLVDGRAFLDELAASWTQYQRLPGRNHEPISAHSHDAWIREYQPSARDPNTLVSYYEKGAWIGLALDLELRLRAASHGQKGSLAGVFRRLMASHGARDKGITLKDIVAASTAEAGEEMAWFFSAYVDGITPLPLPALLKRIGVTVTDRAPWERPPGEVGPEDPARARQRARLRAWSGIEVQGVKVSNIEPGSPAAAAGLMLDDELIAVDGRRASGAEALERIADHPPGDRVALALFRRGQLRTAELTLAEDPRRIYSFTPSEAAPREVAALRDAWLGRCDDAGPLDRCVIARPSVIQASAG